MQILVINYEFPPVGGGGGRVSLDVARELVIRGHDVTVLTSRCKGLPGFERIDGIAVHRVRCLRQRPDRCSVPEMAAFVAAAIPNAIALARRLRPHVMHVHFAVPTGPVALVVNKLLGIPYVLTAHLGDVPGGVPDQTDRLFAFLNPLVRPIWNNARAVTAVSNFVAELARQAYGRSVTVVHNGVRLAQASPDLARAGQPRIVFVGRFNGQKNLPFLVDTLAAVADLPWQAELVGDGPDMGAVAARIEQAGLGGRIRLPGWQDDDKVDSFLAGADVLAIASLSEGFPVVAARALGHGLAVFGSAIPGLADIVDDGVNGVTVDPRNLADSVSGLRRLLGDTQTLQRMRQASQARAREFEMTRVVDRYEQILAAAAA